MGLGQAVTKAMAKPAVVHFMLMNGDKAICGSQSSDRGDLLDPRLCHECAALIRSALVEAAP